MRRKIIFSIILFLLSGISFLGVRFYLARQQPAALQTTATPKSQIFLDGQLLGETPFLTNDIKPGEHTIKIIPTDNTLQSSFEQKLFFTSRLLTAIDMTFRENDALSEGSVISLESISNKKTSELAVLSIPPEATVLLDSNPKGITPLQILDVTPSDHEIALEYSGFRAKKIRLKTSAGYKLIANIKLALSPEQPIASPSASLVPTPTLSKPTIIIKQTPTGFLRVRFTPTLSASEVARVKPGESFPIAEEEADWTKILLPDGRSGWVSNSYITKP